MVGENACFCEDGKRINELTKYKSRDREKVLNDGANKDVFMSESRDTRKIFRRYARLPAEDRGARTVESRRVGDSVRWEMAVGPHPSRKRGSEFSMESANDKIRARPFRHTKFQDVSRPAP